MVWIDRHDRIGGGRSAVGAWLLAVLAADVHWRPAGNVVDRQQRHQRSSGAFAESWTLTGTWNGRWKGASPSSGAHAPFRVSVYVRGCWRSQLTSPASVASPRRIRGPSSRAFIAGRHSPGHGPGPHVLAGSSADFTRHGRRFDRSHCRRWASGWSPSLVALTHAKN